MYAAWDSPMRVSGQRIWAHRRSLMSEDIQLIKAFLSFGVKGYLPLDPKRHRSILYGPFIALKSFVALIKSKIANGGMHDGVR